MSFGFLKRRVNKQKGESWDAYSRRAHRVHREDWKDAKKRSGAWLSKAEYERRTGRPGARD